MKDLPTSTELELEKESESECDVMPFADWLKSTKEKDRLDYELAHRKQDDFRLDLNDLSIQMHYGNIEGVHAEGTIAIA